MTHPGAVTRFDRFSRAILDGSLPYGLSPGPSLASPLPGRFAVVFEHDQVRGAVLILVAAEYPQVEAALSIRNSVGVPQSVVDRVMEDADRFVQEALRGEEGEMLPFSLLPRRVAIRRLRRMLHAH